jgi:ABC-type transport system substrate-binding protein
MTPFKRAFPVVVSVCLAGGALTAARPHYGGTLRIETTDAGAMRRVNALAYETLVTVDATGGLRPLLATSWEPDARGRRWTFHLRRGVRLHDGSMLQPLQVAAALRAVHTDWQIAPDGEAIAIDPGREAPDLAWELADRADAIVIRPAAGSLVGSGPFRVERVEAGLITLRAHDDYWESRPFVDTIEVRTARSPADWLADVETGRADMVPMQPTDARRVEQRQLRIEASRPLELFALAFEASPAATANDALRRTLAAAIDRGAIARVVLQGHAEPADALLPQWVSGYAPFVLAKGAAPLPRSAVVALPADRRTLALRVSASDSLAQAIAQRIAVNARDAGFTLTVQAPAGLGPRFDLRMVRVPVRAAAPADALADVMTGFGTRTVALVGRLTPPEAGASIETVLRTERALLERDVIIPIVHVPELYAVGARLQSWNGPAVLPSGAWNLANVWLSAP